MLSNITTYNIKSFFNRTGEIELLDEVRHRKGARFLALYGMKQLPDFKSSQLPTIIYHLSSPISQLATVTDIP